MMDARIIGERKRRRSFERLCPGMGRIVHQYQKVLADERQRSFELASLARSPRFLPLTAIFAKVGVEDIDPDLATFIRTVIVPMSLAFLLYATGQFSHPDRSRREAGYILILSGSAPARRGSVTSAR